MQENRPRVESEEGQEDPKNIDPKDTESPTSDLLPWEGLVKMDLCSRLDTKLNKTDNDNVTPDVTIEPVVLGDKEQVIEKPTPFFQLSQASALCNPGGSGNALCQAFGNTPQGDFKLAVAPVKKYDPFRFGMSQLTKSSPTVILHRAISLEDANIKAPIKSARHSSFPSRALALLEKGRNDVASDLPGVWSSASMVRVILIGDSACGKTALIE